MSERMFGVSGASLCVEAFGDPADPAILLIHGGGESLLAWDVGFVQRLVDSGRYVIRYDGRDAGRSTGYPAVAPEYDLRDLVADVRGLLDALGLTAAHLVGMSQGAAVAQLVALDHLDRVATLTLVSSTPGGPGHEHPDLPGVTEELEKFFAGKGPAEPDWSVPADVVKYLINSERPFDEDARRAHAERVVGRSADIAAQLTSPFLVDAGEPWRHRLGRISAPTLVLHGTDDLFLPIAHGRALAAEIPNACFIALGETGQEVFPRTQWDVVVPAILEHTGR